MNNVHGPKPPAAAPPGEQYLPALQGLRGIDCPTPGCRANAYGTGMVRWRDGQLYVEVRCTDCHELHLFGTPRTFALGEALRARPAGEHARITATFIAACEPGPHPFRS